MAATTAFYGSLNALKNSIQIIVDVDTRITNLKKVMSEETDFARIMDNARVSAEKFGKTLSEVLDAYTEFARQGYKEQDLINLGDAGLITSNVGEVSAQKAAEYLTSAMVQFKLETKDSMKVIDAWNNVSNRNATTVEKMAAGMAKAGATANAFGLDMDQLNAIIGTVTAATKQSGNEVGNFVKSVLPRLLGKPAQEALKTLNVDFMDKNTGDMRNVVDIYGEVAEKVQHISKIEKNAVLEGLAGKLHISRMTALLDNWKLYEKMLRESKTSEGSASKENEKYMKSLQARIALMKVSLEEIALSLGKAFLTEGFVQTLEFIKFISNGFAGLSNIVGGLPLLLSGAGIAATLLSKNFQAIAIQGTALNRVFTTLGITSKGLQVTLASLGVGVVLFGVGMAIEHLLTKMGEARERAEELARKNRELVDSYNEHKKDVQSLSAEYEKLDKKIKSGVFDTKDIEKFHRVSNQLAKLMPELATGEDQYGNKIIGSNEKIRSRIDLIEKQVAAQEKLDAINKQKDVQDAYDTNKSDLKSAKTRLDSFFYTDENKSPVYSIEEAYKKLEEYQKRLAKGEKLNIIDKGELGNLKDTITSYETLEAEVENLRLAYQKSIMDMIDVNVKLDAQTGQTTKSMINDFTTFVATSQATEGQINSIFDKVLNAVQNDSSFKTTLEGYSSALKEYQDKINSGADTKVIEEYKQKAITAFTEVKNVLMGLAKSGKLDQGDLRTISAQMDGLANSAVLASVDINKLSESTGKSVEELQANLALAPQMEDAFIDTGDAANYSANGIGNETSALGENSGAKLENANAASILFGYTSEQIAQAQEAIGVISLLSGVENLSAQQKEQLAIATSILAQMYPQLNGQISENIGWISEQVGMLNSLSNVSGDNARVMMANQDSITKQTLSEVNSRIRMYQKEIAALQGVYDRAMATADALADQGIATPMTGRLSNLVTRLDNAKLGLATDTSTALQATYKSGVSSGQVKPYNGSSSGGGSGGSKGGGSGSKSSSQGQSAFEKYLDQMDARIAESEARAEALDRTSTAYQNEINTQWKLQTDKAKKYQAEIARLTKSQGANGEEVLKLRESYAGLQKEIAGLNWEFYDAEIQRYSDKVSDLNGEIEYSKKVMELYSDSFAINQIESEKQVAIYKEQIKWLDQERAAMQRAINNGYLNAAQKKEMQGRLEELNKEYIDYQINIKNATKELEDQRQAEKDQIKQKADDFIDAYKAYYEKKKELDQKALDDELSAYEKMVNEKIALIDKEEKARDDSRELSDKQKEISSIQSQINALSGDKSQAGKVADLRKQLAEKQLDLNEYVHDKEVEQRKDALNNELEQKRTEIEEKKKQMDEYYENLLNDEREFARIREEIMKGNVQQFESMLTEFSTYMQSHMADIGQSITENLIDKFAEATDGLKDAKSEFDNMSKVYSGSDMNVSGTDTSKVDKVTIQEDTPLLKKTANGYELSGTTLKKGSVYKAYGVDNKDGVYAVGGGFVTADPKFTKYQRFNTGGFTGNSEGFAWLDKKELIFKEKDSINMLKALDITRQIASMLPKFSIPKIIPNNVANQHQTINMNINIEHMNGTKQGVNDFFKDINNALRSKGGMLFT